jgi:hypothetical protein
MIGLITQLAPTGFANPRVDFHALAPELILVVTVVVAVAAVAAARASRSFRSFSRSGTSSVGLSSGGKSSSEGSGPRRSTSR